MRQSHLVSTQHGGKIRGKRFCVYWILKKLYAFLVYGKEQYVKLLIYTYHINEIDFSPVRVLNILR